MSDNTFSVNRLSRNRSVLTFSHLPKISYMLSEFNIPSIELPTATQATPFRDIPLMGDKIVWSPLQVEFLVSEFLDEWLELFNWMNGLANPCEKDEIPLEYVQATQLIYDSNNIPCIRIVYHHVIIEVLSGLEFSYNTPQNTELSSSAMFQYQHYTIERI